MKTIIFYAASSQNVPKHKIGGAEIGAKRTYNHLIKSGYDVVYVPKVNKSKGFFAFVLAFVKTHLTLKHLFKSKNSNAIFYITSFYKKQARIEALFIREAKKRGLPVIYEPKNGSFVKHYNHDGPSYRQTIDKTIRLVDVIFCQGMEYVTFFETKYQKKTIYVPNYVNGFEFKRPIQNGKLNIVYFGRITQSKNIGLILKTCSILAASFPISCKIIGKGESKYMDFLNNQIESLGLDKCVQLIDYLSFEEIKDICKFSGFFLFPSAEEEEGHSNSLTEAMSFGLVPVVSDNGFNKSVVGDNKFIVESFSAEDYAARIIELYKDFDLNIEFVLTRIEQNYTSDIVVKRQMESIRSIATINTNTNL